MSEKLQLNRSHSKQEALKGYFEKTQSHYQRSLIDQKSLEQSEINKQLKLMDIEVYKICRVRNNCQMYNKAKTRTRTC